MTINQPRVQCDVLVDLELFRISREAPSSTSLALLLIKSRYEFIARVTPPDRQVGKGNILGRSLCKQT